MMFRRCVAVHGVCSLCASEYDYDLSCFQALLMKIDAFHYIQQGTVYRYIMC